MEPICFNMILNEVEFSELERLVRIGFEEDEMLLLNQQFDTPMEVTIKRNIDNITSALSEMNLQYFEVIENDKIVGFTVVSKERDLLYSFGINVKHRSKELVIRWFEELKKLFGYNFYTVLHNANNRAILFLVKNGMVIKDKDNFYTWLYYLTG